MKGLLSSASSNNTNKLSPQEHIQKRKTKLRRSNNTNKLSPQEQYFLGGRNMNSSNNTNKLSPQELKQGLGKEKQVQIIQINLVLKNGLMHKLS